MCVNLRMYIRPHHGLQRLWANASLQSDWNRFDFPDVPAIFTDCPVGGELAHASGVEDGHAGPAFLVAVGLIDLLLGIHIGPEISEQHERVMEQKGIDQRFEQFLIAFGKIARTDAFDDPLEFEVGAIVIQWIVSPCLKKSTPRQQSFRTGRNSRRPLLP